MVKVHRFASHGFSAECYIVWDDETGDAALIDPACEFSAAVSFICENSLSVKGILLTHGHFDHVLSLEKLRRKTGAPVYIHSSDEELLLDSDKCAFSEFFDGTFVCSPADITVSDGDIVRLGSLKFKVMHAPGHTSGSVCYFIDDIIFSGDVLFKGSVGRTDLYGSSRIQMHCTLEKLKKLNRDYTVYPGHGESTMLKREIEYNPYMK